MTSLVYLLFI